MSRISFALPLVAAIAFRAEPAHAQIYFRTMTTIVQEEREVGLVYVGLPPGPCRSVEVFLLNEDYAYPGAGSDGFTVQPGRDADVAIEELLRSFWDRHPEGRVVTVEIEEFSEACR